MNKSSSRNVRRFGVLLQAGTALPLLIASGAHAAAIQQTSAGDIVVDEASASGTPTAVDLDSTGGTVTVTVDQVTGDAAAGAYAPIIDISAATGITADFGTIVGTGAGDVRAVQAMTNAGDVNVTVDSVVMDGRSTSGVFGYSASGDVTVAGNNVLLNGTEIDQNYVYFPDGLVAISDDGNATVIGGTVETHGIYGSAAAAVGTDSATVTIDHAINYGDGAVGILSQADGNATVTANLVEAFGNGDAIEVISTGSGTALADVGTVISEGLGVLARSASGTAQVNFDQVDAVRSSIVINNTKNAVIVGSEGSSVSSDGFNAVLVNVSGDATVDVGSASTAGGTASAIRVISFGTIGITADSVAVTGPGIDPGADQNNMRIPQGGVIVTAPVGPTTIDVGTVDVDGQYRYGIHVQGNGVVNLTADDVSLESADSVAVAVRGGAGDISLTTGTVVTTGASGVGVFGHTTSGNVDINADVTRVENTGYQGQFTGDAVVGSSDSGVVSITSNDASSAALYGTALAAIGGGGAIIYGGLATTTGDGGVGVYGVSTGGDVSIAVDTVDVSGTSTQSVYGQADQGNVMVSVGALTASAADAQGIRTIAGGDTTISADSITTSRTGIQATANNGGAIGIDVGSIAMTGGKNGQEDSAILAETDGAVTIAADTVSVTGLGYDPGADSNNLRIRQGGIIVSGGAGPVTVDAGTVDVDGQYRYAIAVDSTGPITVNADSVSNESDDSLAVGIRGGTGDVSITTGTVVATGVSGSGILGQTTSGNIAINADVTRAEGEGITGPYTGDAVTAISQTGNVSVVSNMASSAGYGGSAVIAIGGADVSVASNEAVTTGDGGIAVYAYGKTSGGATTVEANSITTTGDNLRALYAYSLGTTEVRVGDVTTNSELSGALGLLVRGTDATTVVRGAVSTGGMAINSQSIYGTSTVIVEGSVSSVQDIGISTVAQTGQVSVESGGSVDAKRAAVVFTNLDPNTPGFVRVYNDGSITGSVAVYANPNQNGVSSDIGIYNNGTLTGTTSGYAVITGNGTDVLELTENSIVNGMVNLGAGDDTLALEFTDGAAAGAVGNVAATENVEHLSVSSGNWLAATGNSFYNSIAIDEGSTLTVAQDNGYVSAIAPFIDLYGQLNLLLTTDSSPGDLTGLDIQGDGSVHLTGPATLLVDDASGLNYTGGTYVENGTLLLTDRYDGDIYTSGSGVFQLGDGGTVGDLTGNLINEGTFVFNRSDDYTLTGDFSGSGQFDKYGAGTVYFSGLYDFDGPTTIYSGAVGLAGTIDPDAEIVLTDGGTFDLSQVDGGEATISDLSGDGGSLVLGTTALTVNQESDGSFGGSLAGTGTFTKDGSGDLKLTGNSPSFTGGVEATGGTLSVNGDYSNAAFLVTSGGTLGGNGTIGNTTVQGGTFAPGNSIDTITVNGNLAFTSASVFEVEANAAGQADRVNATGTATLGGATVNVLAASGIYAPVTDYTILTAAGGVSGTFGKTNSNLAFLDPSLIYTANTVTLRLSRNDVDYSTYAATPNQAAVGNLIETLGYGNTLYNTTLVLDRGQVADSFQTLTGEIYPAFGAALIESVDLVRRQSMGAMVMGGPGTRIWGAAVQGQVDGDGGNSFADVSMNGAGVLAGVSFGVQGMTASVGAGKVWYEPMTYQLDDAGLTMAVAQFSYGAGSGLSAKVGAQFGWGSADVSRSTRLGTLSNDVTGEADVDMRQYYGEVGFDLAMGGEFAVTPFVGLRRIELDFDKLVETGGATALTLTDMDRDVNFADVGLRFASMATGRVAPYASANLRRAWGDRASTAAIGFAGNTSGLGISALPISKSAVQAGLGATYRGTRVSGSIGYEGNFSKSFDSHGLKAELTFAF